jgi:O-6-methylguanine DNA methyltransferase
MPDYSKTRLRGSSTTHRSRKTEENVAKRRAPHPWLEQAPQGLRIQQGQVAEIGRVWVALDATGAIVALHAVDLDARRLRLAPSTEPLCSEIGRALCRYVDGDTRGIDALRLVAAPTAFTAAVRDVLRAIPRGTVMTYGEVARRMGKPSAARAVGRACAANPIPIVVPCHRVVANGSEGGYGLGLQAKRKLLELEGLQVQGGEIFARTRAPKAGLDSRRR